MKRFCIGLDIYIYFEDSANSKAFCSLHKESSWSLYENKCHQCCCPYHFAKDAYEKRWWMWLKSTLQKRQLDSVHELLKTVFTNNYYRIVDWSFIMNGFGFKVSSNEFFRSNWGVSIGNLQTLKIIFILKERRKYFKMSHLIKILRKQSLFLTFTSLDRECM